MSSNSPISDSVDGSDMRFAIVAARYNQSLVDSMVSHATDTLISAGATGPTLIRVLGSNELPYAVSVLAKSGAFNGIIAIGLVIAGSTNHHNIIGNSCAQALHSISIETQIPIINGVTVVENQEQAEERAGEKYNRGREFANAALELVQFNRTWINLNKK
ncbi:MAG TPA: 6,7-dimethyl-8-ribityllumazine synthase [Opitutae bacterium]|nr:6,7-dimethyl-8-ribityllumazine synthase [Coraliomargarita sp.]HBO57022.1 6,7-dimethyl-8-ribityllumazine synthase [Opitutae bacterium]|tara:strand:- start:463 stop:942 length:480 start_codon:yes stop_codon:yes gene_type:complete